MKYIPSKILLDDYRYLFSFAKFQIYFKNSLLVSLLSAPVATTTSLLSGYVLSRFTFKDKRLRMIILFFVQMIPFYVLVIPLFTMLSKLRLTNTLTRVLLVYSGYGAAFGTIMARTFFNSIPTDLEEAAWLDGFTKIGALFRVVIPVLLPGVSAIFAFCFVNSWNEVFTPVLFIHSDHKMTSACSTLFIRIQNWHTMECYGSRYHSSCNSQYSYLWIGTEIRQKRVDSRSNKGLVQINQAFF